MKIMRIVSLIMEINFTATGFLNTAPYRFYYPEVKTGFENSFGNLKSLQIDLISTAHLADSYKVDMVFNENSCGRIRIVYPISSPPSPHEVLTQLKKVLENAVALYQRR